MSNKSFERLLISKNESIKSAMNQLNETAEKVLYVTNEQRQLMGALSDGDIRRALLSNYSLDDKIKYIHNNNPKSVYAFEENILNKVQSIMLDLNIESVPIVNEHNIIVDVIFWVDIFKGQKENKVINKDNYTFILAGGKGSRLEPFTKIIPKPLFPIGNQPILEKIMDKFKQDGFNKFIVSLNYKADMIKTYFNDPNIYEKYEEIEYIIEEMPLGTIGSLNLIKEYISKTFFISNADIIIEESLQKIYEFHKQREAILTIVGCFKNSIIPYGVLNSNSEGYLDSIEEKPSYQHIINTGVYVAEPQIIEYIQPKEKMDITELIYLLLQRGHKINIYPILEHQWFDIGQWSEYNKTIKYFNER